MSLKVFLLVSRDDYTKNNSLAQSKPRWNQASLPVLCTLLQMIVIIHTFTRLLGRLSLRKPTIALSSTARRQTVVRFCPRYSGGETGDIGHPNWESLEKLIWVFFLVVYERSKFFRLDSSLREQKSSEDYLEFLEVRE